MNFKKTIYSLISAGIFAGCLCQPVSAESMERILKESDLLKISKVRLLISRFDFAEFVSEKKSKLVSEPHYIENVKHFDSVMFWCFCVICHKNDLSRYIDTIAELRNFAEFKEDVKTFKHSREDIIAELEENFGITTTAGELQTIYSSIMSKRVEIPTETGRRRLDITREQQLLSGKKKKCKRKKVVDMWQYY